MGLCTSKPSPNPFSAKSDSRSTPVHPRNDDVRRKSNSVPASPLPDAVNGNRNQNPKEDQGKEDGEKESSIPNNEGKKSPFFPFYSPSPAHYLFSKKSPARSSANSTPKRIFRRPFPPPSPAKHIMSLLARRHGSVKPNEASIPEGSEAEAVAAAGGGGTGLDKSFGFSKHFGSKYELGDEVGRGHFGYTCAAKFKKGELKGQEVAVKVIPKAKRLDPLCGGGELLDRILSRGGKYTEDDAKAVMIQILNVVAFCHLQGVVHRDLKPENFLFTSKDENSQLKAIDFGLSDYVKPGHPWIKNYNDVKVPLDILIFKMMKVYLRSSSLRKAALRALMKNATDAMKDSRIPEFLASLNALQYRRMDFDEFCAAALSVHQLEALDRWEQHARCAYELFEKDGNRAIMIEELASELGLGPSVPVHNVLHDWIRHTDGKLSFLGFVKLLHGVSGRTLAKAQ
ncbi:hypothetical protein CCACVL1_26330 [Corchorus capsularis]|uniref:non-specific serine/threonine protein kinase n=1 Tax=Corchorus capsularis TaxID=210143 RepID=A0A1R3GF81_COCAP|nr:hypothetical protein CCACVL1_26330 [Corchorus capsularis]